MSSKATNLLTGNAEQSAVYRSSEGKNQGKTTYIVLTISRVRSAVYRSLLNTKRGRIPSKSDLFFCLFEGAANAYNTTDSHNQKQPLADTNKEETAAPQPSLYPFSPPSLERATVIVLFPLCHKALGNRIWAISKVGRDLQEVCSKRLAIGQPSVQVRYIYNGRMHHVSNVP